MRSPLLALIAASLVCLSAGTQRLSAASDTTTKTVAAHASVASRTSLAVSSERLQFQVAGADQPAIATVEFVAAIRTHAGAEVVLTVEETQALAGPGGAADVDAAITFSGEGEGTLNGALATPRPSIVGRWVGSGRRTGRIAFALRAAVAGSYSLPVRFVLTAP